MAIPYNPHAVNSPHGIGRDGLAMGTVKAEDPLLTEEDQVYLAARYVDVLQLDEEGD